MEELSTSEATCLAVTLPVQKETVKAGPASTEQLCYYSLHDQCLSVTLGARGTEVFRLVEGNCSDAASETVVSINEG